MGYTVKIQPAALEDAQEYVVFMCDERHEPFAAARWYDRLTEAILSLGEMPARCPIIPEQDSFGISLRHLIFYSHRIIFSINEADRTVHVLRVYHGARDALMPNEIDLPL